ncbi:C2H2-type zinc finger protein, partial [Campylobacter jejuni]|uniref:C2H2-type zinc finger protein n=1 Tax=Campylobacter jejuni TaxID=197 RepID=UPI00352AB9EE
MSSNGKLKFECSVCPKSFLYSSKLKDHMSVHSVERHYECSKCNKKVKNKYYLKRHMKTHSEKYKTYKCDECSD